MQRITVESIPIVVGREDDGGWWADIESMPGVMAYGATRDSAIAAITVKRFPSRWRMVQLHVCVP
jgi:hypothetical protein